MEPASKFETNFIMYLGPEVQKSRFLDLDLQDARKIIYSMMTYDDLTKIRLVCLIRRKEKGF